MGNDILLCWRFLISILCFVMINGIIMFYFLNMQPFFMSKLYLFLNYDFGFCILIATISLIIVILIFGLLSSFIKNVHYFMFLSILFGLLSIIEFYAVFYLIANRRETIIREDALKSRNSEHFHLVEETFRCCGNQNLIDAAHCGYKTDSLPYERIPTCSVATNNWFRIIQNYSIYLICICCITQISIGFIFQKIIKTIRHDSLKEYE